MSLFREPFWREYALVVLATIVLGAGVAAGAAYALDAALDDAASGLLGTVGQYQLIVHVRQDYRVAAARELPRLVADRYPQVTVREGVTVAGNSNFLLAVPDELLQQEVLEDLASLLEEVPGFNGYMWLLEPSLTVSGLRPGVQDLVAREAAALDGVRLAVRHGSSVTVLLESIEARRGVAAALSALLAGRQVAEVRFPEDAGPVDAAQLVDALRAALGHDSVAAVTGAEATGGSWSSLAAVRDLLAAAAARVRIAPLPDGPELAVGDRLVLQGEAAEPPVPGLPPDPDHLIVEVAQRSTGAAIGMIIHGDAAESEEAQPETAPAAAAPEDAASQGGGAPGGAAPGAGQPAYRLVDGVVGPPAGIAVIEGPRLAPGLEAQLAQQLQQLGATAREAANRLGDLMALLAPEGYQAATQARAERLVRALRSGDGAAAVREALLGVALSALMRTARAQAAAGDAAADAATEAGGVPVDSPAAGSTSPGTSGSAAEPPLAQLQELQAALVALAERAEAIDGAGAGEWLARWTAIQRRLAELRDDELTRLLQAVDGVTGGGRGARLELLVDKGVSAGELERLVREATGHDATVITTSAGAVSPSPRSMVMELLADVRRSVAGLLALLATAMALILDHATVLAGLKRFPVPDRAVKGLGAAVGALLAGGMYWLSRAGIPFIGPGTAAAIGALLGLATAVLAERLSPVSADEILAGQSLGLSGGQILREIVVPTGRPGLLSLVNRWRREFR
ncbi:MAG TPA: hypothetical protein VIK93_07910 [Limnochordales bacterium]